MIKAYCLSCGSANSYVNGIKPTVCARCKRSLTQKAATATTITAAIPEAKPSYRNVTQVIQPRPIRASYTVEDDEDSDIDLSVLNLSSSDISYELDFQEPTRKFTLGDAIDSPMKPQAKEKTAKISKAALKRNLKSMMDSQKSSKGKTE